MRAGALLLAFAAALCGQNPLARPDPFAGSFQGDQVTLDLTGGRGQYSGSLTVQGSKLPVTVKQAGQTASGAFEAQGQTYSFTLTPDSGGPKMGGDGAADTCG